jgi:hypothetical protein
MMNAIPMDRPPILTTLQDGAGCFRFNGNWRMASVANYMVQYKGPLMVKDVTKDAHADTFKTYARGMHETTGSMLHFSRDEGMHTIGWVKEPLCDRAVHLWMQFYRPDANGIPGLIIPDATLPDRWLSVFFGRERRNLIWCEPPIEATSRLYDLWHYRMFVDKNGFPLNVGSDELLNRGWKLFPDLQYERRKVVKN